MTDITITSREIARASVAWPFDIEALAAIADREAVAAALAGYRHAMTPTKQLPKAERDENNRQLAEAIRSIGLRVRPDFSEDQARMWLAAMVEALEDQPSRIALAATRDALHFPVRFPGEVHGVILDKALPHRLTYERAIRNLEKLLDRLDHPPMLTASSEAKAQAEAASERDLQLMPPALRSLGLSGGWLIAEPDDTIRWATEAEQEAHQRRLEDERRVARARENAR